MSKNIRDLVKGLKGIHVNEFDSGLNIWFHPDFDHSSFWKSVKEHSVPCEYMGIDEVGGRHSDCYFFPF